MSTACINVFWNESEDQYVVQHLASAPEGGSGDFGAPIVVSANEFDSKIVNIVLEGLEKYPHNIYQPRLMDGQSRKRMRDFLRSHKLVSIAKSSTGEILVTACEHRGVLFGGVKNGEAKLRPKPTSDELLNALHEAFQKAT